MDENKWRRSRFPNTVASFGVDDETYDKILAYTTQHNLNLSEFLRKAVLFFLLSEYANGVFEYPTSVPHKPKRKKSKKGDKK